MIEFADTKEIVELGSGAGKNIFALALTGNWRKISGYELSFTGIEVSRKVIKYFNLNNIEIGYIDLLNIESDGFRYLKGATVFTYYCLEQLPDQVEQALRNLIKAQVKRVINIEPSLELFNRYSLKDLATISYIWRQNYLNNLVMVARKLENEGLINIIYITRLHFAPTLRNDPTLIVWELI